MPAGRPTKYKPEYCDQVREFLKDGYSVAGFAGSIPISVQTVYNWMEEHPEFLDAVKAGQAAAALWWEDIARANAQKSEGNATTIIFGLKNRVPLEWRDRKELDHTSSDGTMSPQNVDGAIVSALVDKLTE